MQENKERIIYINSASASQHKKGMSVWDKTTIFALLETEWFWCEISQIDKN